MDLSPNLTIYHRIIYQIVGIDIKFEDAIHGLWLIVYLVFFFPWKLLTYYCHILHHMALWSSNWLNIVFYIKQ